MDDILILAAILCGVTIVAVFVNKRLLTLLLSSVFMLLVAMRLSIPSMYLMGAVLLALPAASYVVGRFGARYLRVTLKAPDSVFEGDTVVLSVEVHSPLAAFSTLARPRFELPQWLSPVAGSETTAYIPGGVRKELRLTAERRGVYNLSLGSMVMNDPLGIFAISRRLPQSGSLTVYPIGLSRDVSVGLSRSQVGWLLDASTGRRGDEEGFYGTREYRVGDDMRRIHWRSTARYGSPIIAERETSAAATIWLCLDVQKQAHGGMSPSAVLEQAVKTSVSMMEGTLRYGHAVGLFAPGAPAIRIPPGVTEDHRWVLLDALARVEPNGEIPLARAVLDAGIERGATVVILTGTPTRGLVDTAATLISFGAQVALVVMDDTGWSSPIDGGALLDEGLRAAAAVGAEAVRVPIPEPGVARAAPMGNAG